jgi:hypothetical protein
MLVIQEIVILSFTAYITDYSAPMRQMRFPQVIRTETDNAAW